MYRSVGLALLVLAGVIDSASSCLCMERPEIYFCKSDFAVALKVKDSGTVEGLYKVYRVDLLRMYRAVPFENLDTDRVLTAGDTVPWCGVDFIKDAFYVISGYFNVTAGQPTRMQANSCEIQLISPNDPRLTYIPPECETQNGYSGG
ncbi:uncharacterized protein LOC123539134 [Mercenaria mercenaria]|uniref:uncharacterized protein LOC123539134 n=1 Tax=Mercenaria mercenaria TaxID=6596 RepID=UPI00234F49B3|nr:uncharacterized protein LOC123539134 [Mercenaria mercenaria]